jgi:hypothetical protein
MQEDKKMNWKKLLIIGLAVGGFAFASASQSQAGVSVGIGFGVPYGYGYGCYPYGYGYPYGGYGYGYYPYRSHYRPTVYFSSGRRWYRHRGYRYRYGW